MLDGQSHRDTGLCTYQQALRYIQDNNMDTNPRKLFMVDFLAVLTSRKKRGERFLIFIDMNEHILEGPLAKRLMGDRLGLLEATYQHWERY